MPALDLRHPLSFSAQTTKRPARSMILGRYPRRSSRVLVRENVRPVGTVKGNGVLVTLATGNILER